LRRNHELALAGRDLVRAALGLPAPAPDDMLGSMASLPMAGGPPPAPMRTDPLQDRLWREHRIEIPMLTAPDGESRLIRLSAQAYNELGEYALLAEALAAAAGEGAA
jgi:isopenicillin-N epimerase